MLIQELAIGKFLRSFPATRNRIDPNGRHDCDDGQNQTQAVNGRNRHRGHGIGVRSEEFVHGGDRREKPLKSVFCVKILASEGESSSESQGDFSHGRHRTARKMTSRKLLSTRSHHRPAAPQRVVLRVERQTFMSPFPSPRLGAAAGALGLFPE